MTKHEIFKAILDWEWDAGESFIDYFDSNIRTNSLMIWAWGRGYISVEQWNMYEEALATERFGIDSMDVLEGYECPYAITTDEEWEKGRMILAEFMSESTIYQKRLAKFFADDDSEDDEDDE